ncbi:MAG: helix-turn-helix transcriptional regulator [Clostridia bacterium]|nr:helix-turn-helix transcriptional regulator [Clostridia bacterium]
MTIKAFLTQRNMTQYRLAKLVGLPIATIKLIENSANIG